MKKRQHTNSDGRTVTSPLAKSLARIVRTVRTFFAKEQSP